MIDGFEYGYAQGEDTVWCIRREGTESRMLCGRKVGFVPVQQPTRPKNVHRDCLEAMYGPTKPEPTGYGTCPACGGHVAVDAGRIQAHGELRIDGDGVPYASDTSCLGVNLRPRGKR